MQGELINILLSVSSLFNIYADVLLEALKESDLGCHIGRRYVGCIAYADDIILPSASILGFQRMLDSSSRGSWSQKPHSYERFLWPRTPTTTQLYLEQVIFKF